MNSINSRSWTTGAVPDLLHDYYEWTITPDPGFALDVTGFAVTFRSSATGPDEWQLRTSVDSFAALVVGFSSSDSTDNFRLTFNNPLLVSVAPWTR
jgi:hypothetical protein